MSRDLIFVALSLMTWGIGEGMFFLFQPLYLEELGANPIMIGNILGAIGLAMTISHLPAGYLADRIGRRPILLTAWVMGAAAAWIMAISKTLPLFVFGSAFYGITTFVIAPLNSYVTAARGNWTVGRTLTLVSAAFNAGSILGPLLGGWVGNQYGLRNNFLIAASFFSISSFIIFFIRPQPVDHPNLEIRRLEIEELLNARYLRFLFMIFIVMFSMYLPQPLSQNFLQNERGINLTQIGVLISARSVGIVLLNLVLGQLNARVGFLVAQFTMAFFTFLLWRGEGFNIYLIGYLLMGSYQTARSLATAQGRVMVKASNMGLAYGMIESAMALAIILAPPLAGYLYTQNPLWIYTTSLVLITTAFVYTIAFSPLRSEDLTIFDKEKP